MSERRGFPPRKPTWEHNLLPSTVLVLSYLLDAQAEAKEYLDWSNAIVGKITNVTNKIADKNRPTVFIDRNAVTTNASAGVGSGYSEIVEMAGGYNLAGKRIPGVYPIVSPEWVVGQNPDYFIVVGSKGGYESNDSSNMMGSMNDAKTKFATTKGIKENKIHVLHYDIFLGSSNPVGMAYLAKWLHPNEFQDLDPLALHKEFLNKFSGGVVYDPATQGVFYI